jgi:hypothetical protein
LNKQNYLFFQKWVISETFYCYNFIIKINLAKGNIWINNFYLQKNLYL